MFLIQCFTQSHNSDDFFCWLTTDSDECLIIGLDDELIREIRCVDAETNLEHEGRGPPTQCQIWFKMFTLTHPELKVQILKQQRQFLIPLSRERNQLALTLTVKQGYIFGQSSLCEKWGFQNKMLISCLFTVFCTF